MVASRSWTWHFHLITVTMWVGSFSLMVIKPSICHTIHYFVLGQYYQFILVSPTCSREVIQFKLHPLQYRKPSFSWPPFLNLMSPVTFCLQKTLHSFCVVDVWYIKALLRWVASCRHQHIIQEVDLETPFQYLETCIHQCKVSRFWR